MNFTKRFAPSVSFTDHQPTVVKKEGGIEHLRNRCQQLLAQADVNIDGSRSWDIQVHNNNFYSRIFADGSLGLGEAYMDGWWDCEVLDQFFFRVMRVEHLKALLLTERDNSLLVRFMLEHKSDINKLWQKSGGLNQTLDAMFPSGLDEAYCMAGENYLEGSWYAEARMAFVEAIKINPDCQEAKSGLRIMGKRLKELAHMLEREYTLANSNQVQGHSLSDGNGWGTRIRT